MGLRKTGWVMMLAAACALGQSRYKPDLNAETPEGKLLQQIAQQDDQAKRVELLDQFLAAHGSHASAPWARAQMVKAAAKIDPAKVMDAAEKLVAQDPTDVEMAYAGLEAAVAKANNDLIAKWAAMTVAAGKKASAAPEPKDEEELERWKYKVSFSKPDQAPKRAEYEMYAAAARTQDPAARVKIMDSLMALNPQTEYAAQLQSIYVMSYRQLNQNDKALAVAAKAAEAGAADEDMLLLLANAAFEKKDAAGVIANADKLTAYLKDKAAPAGSDPAAWEKKKANSLGVGWWFKGMTLAGQSKWKETDATLREAVPYLQGNTELLSHALFNIGLANYKLGNLAEALKYNRECAAIKGPMQAQAATNAGVIAKQAAAAAPKKAAGKK